MIHDQDRAWLAAAFDEGAPKYSVNVTRLMRNIIWQTRQRVVREEREKLQELVRTV